MKPCDCRDRHVPRRVVLTGGPGAGKTAVLELIRLFFCEHVKTLPEAAGIVFGGRFPRSARPPLRQAAQRAIYYIQRELESVAEAENAAVVLCDRGTVDCAAYWTGDGDLFSAVRTTREMVASAPVAAVAVVAPTEKSVRGAAAQGEKTPSRVLARPRSNGSRKIQCVQR